MQETSAAKRKAFTFDVAKQKQRRPHHFLAFFLAVGGNSFA
jgi:hypothetical protein